MTARLAELALGDGGSRQPGDLHRLLALHDDTLASVRWTLEHDETSDRALVLIAVLWGVIHNSSAGEIHRLGEQVLTTWPESPRRLWLFAVATVATCRFLDGDTSGATELAKRGLERAEQSASAAALLWRVVGQSAVLISDVTALHETSRNSGAGVTKTAQLRLRAITSNR